MGILSGLVMVFLKKGSKYPTMKKRVMAINIQSAPLLVHSLYTPHCLFFLSNQSVGGNIKGNATVRMVNEIVGAERKSIKLFIKCMLVPLSL